MLQYDRQQSILDYLRTHHSARVGQIAGAIFTSEASVRRDLAALEAKGLVERRLRPGSRKEMLVTVLPLGRVLYEDYSQEILRWHFAPMFRELDQIPSEAQEHLRNALFAAMRGSKYWTEREER